MFLAGWFGLLGWKFGWLIVFGVVGWFADCLTGVLFGELIT